MTPERLAQLEQLAAELNAVENDEEFLSGATEFYHELYDAKRQPQLVEMIDKLRDEVAPLLDRAQPQLRRPPGRARPPAAARVPPRRTTSRAPSAGCDAPSRASVCERLLTRLADAAASPERWSRPSRRATARGSPPPPPARRSSARRASRPALPAVQAALRASATRQVGLITAAYMLPGVLFAMPLGYLADRGGAGVVFSSMALLYGDRGRARRRSRRRFGVLLGLRVAAGHRVRGADAAERDADRRRASRRRAGAGAGLAAGLDGAAASSCCRWSARRSPASRGGRRSRRRALLLPLAFVAAARARRPRRRRSPVHARLRARARARRPRSPACPRC